MADSRPTVLVLAAGGNVSQGIQKALALGPTSWRVVAACVSPQSAGLHVAERSYISPYAVEPGFVDWVADTAEREGAVAVLSGSEEILAELAPHAEDIRARTGAAVIVSPPEVLEIAHDKLRTARWLEENGLPFPRYAPAEDGAAVDALIEECGWPLVVKPRRGKGGRGVSLVEDRDELIAMARYKPPLVVQEHLGAADEEYSAGCVCDADGVLRATMVLRRELREGTSVVAYAGAYPDVAQTAGAVVSALRPVGPCNVQLRLRDGEPVPFELNVRFSGTTPVRARMGFQEVDALVRHFALGEPLAELRPAERGTMTRYWNEIYVEDGDLEALGGGGPVAGHGHVEDWGTQR